MGNQKQMSPGDLLQVALTLAAIAVALATLTLDRGPRIASFRVLPVALLLGGLPAVFASMTAMGEIWWSAEMAPSDILGHTPWNPARNRQIDETYTYHAIILTTWSIYLLGALYVVLLILTAPS